MTTPTLYVAFELSRDSWKLSMTDGLGRPPRIREVSAGNEERLQIEVELSKARFGLPDDAPVVSCYEAGRDGFWIHRWLSAMGWTNYVIDPASIEVNRRKRRAKTDRLDAERMVMTLIRYCLGDQHACRPVNVPSWDDEDARQLNRELDGLTEERTSHINRMKGLLFSQGIRIEEIGKDFPQWLSQVETGDGHPLPQRLQERVIREFERLQIVVRQMRELEKQRANLYRQAMRQEGEEAPKWQSIAVHLRQLSGIGDHSAMTLATELFGWRELKNRRQVAALAGLTPSPWQSGSTVDAEQGISKAGRGELRSLLIEIAWGWVQFQPTSSLTMWFVRRFAGGNSRQRRVGIVALARKLLVALWKYVKTGLVPENARFTKSPYRFAYTRPLE
jgi:transposase